MNSQPITTYYEAYYFYELYDEYLQIHQSTGVIPFPYVLKKDGEKFYFQDIKSLTFFKEIEIVGQDENMEDIHEEAFTCYVKMTKQPAFKIKSFISWEGRYPENKTDDYRLFINELKKKAQQHTVKVYASAGMMSRINKAVPFIKIGGITSVGFLVFTALMNIMMDMGDLFEVLFDDYFLGLAIPIVIGLLFLPLKFYFSKSKRETEWTDIEREYLPLLSYNPKKTED